MKTSKKSIIKSKFKAKCIFSEVLITYQNKAYKKYKVKPGCALSAYISRIKEFKSVFVFFSKDRLTGEGLQQLAETSQTCVKGLLILMSRDFSYFLSRDFSDFFQRTSHNFSRDFPGLCQWISYTFNKKILTLLLRDLSYICEATSHTFISRFVL